MQVVLFSDIADTVGYGKYAGTYKIATEVRSHGYSCQVIDNFSWLGVDRLKILIDKFITNDTILVGFSCTLNEKRSDGKLYHWGITDEDFFNVLKYIKSKNKKIKTCVGGARITIISDWPDIDYSIINKGDSAVLALLDHIQNNTSIKYISNKHTKAINGDDYFYTQEQFNRSKILYEPNDIILPTESLPMEIARGCIFSCAYCHFDLIGKRIGDWTKTPDNIREELVRNYELYGTTNYMFSDELINESLPKLEMLANVVSQLPFKIRYTSYARVDLIKRYPEMRELLLESGAASLAFGIETLNEQAGKAVGKGMNPNKVKETLTYCKELWQDKIIISSNFIIGLPGETEDSVWSTVNYLVSDECPLDMFGFLPLFIRANEDGRPGSKIDLNPKKFGYIVEEGKAWQGQTMSFTEASSLVRKIYQRKDVQQKTKFSAATWVGRILALGYTVDEIFSIMKDSNIQGVSLDIEKRTNKMKNQYFKKLLSIGK